MDCTFKPRINQKRRTDSEDQFGDHYSNRFEQLFLDAESRRRRRAECMQWYPEGLDISSANSLLEGLSLKTHLRQRHWMMESVGEGSCKVH
jgi:hypothetical protein